MDRQTKSKIAERKRQRREYLRQKGEAYASIAASGALILFSLGLLLLGFAAARRGHTEPVDGLVIGLLALALAAGCGWGIYWGARDVRATKRSADRIPYVPPATAEHLPPEEILVRGSEEPSPEPRESLLRPASDRETPHEELLRLTMSDASDRTQDGNISRRDYAVVRLGESPPR